MRAAQVIVLGLLAPSALSCGRVEMSPSPTADDPVVNVNGASPAAPDRPPLAEMPDTPAAPMQSGGDCTAEPPPLVLRSRAGTQVGVIGGYCVDNDRLGCGVCVSRFLLPNEWFTIAHPGDELTIEMPGARLSSRTRCTPACSLAAEIDPMICVGGQLESAHLTGELDGPVQRTLIDQDEPWTLAIDPGLYLIRITGGGFEAPDGWSGEASGSFALLVDPERERAIVPAATLEATWQATCASGSIFDDAGDGSERDAAAP